MHSLKGKTRALIAAGTVVPVAALGIVLGSATAFAGGNHPTSTSTTITVDHVKYQATLDSSGAASIKVIDGTLSKDKTVSVVAYKGSESGQRPSATNVQTRQDIDTASFKEKAEVNVTPASCNSQLDLIWGADAPQTLTTDWFSAHHVLILWLNGKKTCETPSSSPPSSPASPTFNGTASRTCDTAANTFTVHLTASGLNANQQYILFNNDYVSDDVTADANGNIDQNVVVTKTSGNFPSTAFTASLTLINDSSQVDQSFGPISVDVPALDCSTGSPSPSPTPTPTSHPTPPAAGTQFPSAAPAKVCVAGHNALNIMFGNRADATDATQFSVLDNGTVVQVSVNGTLTYAPVVQPGQSVTVTVTTPGVYTVSGYAEFLAGGTSQWTLTSGTCGTSQTPPVNHPQPKPVVHPTPTPTHVVGNTW